ncbi:MAG: iron ABC transporter substrate-binding protein [Methanothrix sp.]|nr:MAG: Periplasmic binding protein [Methanosaeta sp. PtaU1.Bin112]
MKPNIGHKTTGVAALLLLASILCIGTMPAVCAEKTITDMEGRTMTVSEPIERVVTAGYGMTPCVMAAFGIGDRIIGTGGASVSGTSVTGPGNETTATFLIPGLKNMTDLGRGPNLNVEAAVALNPDLMILEKDCAGQGGSNLGYNKLIDQLLLFNKSFPLVIIKNAACNSPPSPDSVYSEIELLGEIFDKQDKARELTDFLKDEVNLASQRTEGIAEDEKPTVLVAALSGSADIAKGKLATVLPDYDCATLYPEITGIKNAYTGEARAVMSAEQLIALDPDVIILVRGARWKPSDLYENEDYKALQSIKAIKNKRVYSTGHMEYTRNMAGLEFPIEILIEAKAAYPEKFSDVNVGEQLTKHYKAVYDLNEDQVKRLKEEMELDWMDEEGF